MQYYLKAYNIDCFTTTESICENTRIKYLKIDIVKYTPKKPSIVFF